MNIPKLELEPYEEIAPVPELEGIWATTFGRIVSTKRNPDGIFLQPYTHSTGYRALHIDDHYYYVHRLVMSAFDRIPARWIKNPEVHHKTKVKKEINDSLDNLSYVPQSCHAMIDTIKSISIFPTTTNKRTMHNLTLIECALFLKISLYDLCSLLRTTPDFVDDNIEYYDRLFTTKNGLIYDIDIEVKK